MSAKDQGTQKEQQIVLQSSGELSTEKIEQMVYEVQQFAESDKQKKDLIEVVNSAESAIYDTQQNMEEYKSQLPPEELKNVEEEISELNNVVENKDEPAETVRETTNNLPRAAIALFEFTYKNRGSSGEGSSGERSSSDGSLSQHAGPPPSIKHISNPLRDFVEEPHRLLRALLTFDRAGMYPNIEDEELLNFDS